MASGEDPCPEHHEPTRSSGFRYCFSIAHHGRGVSDDSQWIVGLRQDEEFSIFDESDRLHFSDSKGHYFGLRRSPEGVILDLGTQGEQIAKFWNPVKNNPTHGFPLWPLGDEGPENRKQEPPPREALLLMEHERLLSKSQTKRLLKGDRAK
jgi:hypothetical protein